MTDKYILDGKTLKPATLMEWARWFKTADRHVARDVVGDLFVSTVFLGLDHNFGPGEPLLFETMVFDPDRNDLWSDRCSTWEQAEEMHRRACEFARQSLIGGPDEHEPPRLHHRRRFVSLRSCDRQGVEHHAGEGSAGGGAACAYIAR